MTQWSRRKLLKSLAAASTAAVIPAKRARAQAASSTPASQPEIQITSVSAHTFRLSILAARDGSTGAIPSDGSLVRDSFGPPLATVREQPEHPVVAGNFKLTVSLHPVSITIANQRGLVVQQLGWDQSSGVLSFASGNSPLFGLGEGGPQFDRRGSTDRMHSGQGGYQLATHGGRVPVPWIIGTSGWAIFFHQPFGTFDFTGPQGKFLPASPESALPLDLFFVGPPIPQSSWRNTPGSRATRRYPRYGALVTSNRIALLPVGKK
jgi:alpha-glucosidase